MVKTKLGYRLFVLNEVVIVEMAFESWEELFPMRNPDWLSERMNG